MVKEAGSNPDVMGSNPMTSRFFPFLLILLSKIDQSSILLRRVDRVQSRKWELGSDRESELGYLVPGRPGQPASHPHFCHGRELFGFHAHSSHLHPQTQRNPINPDCSLLGKKTLVLFVQRCSEEKYYKKIENVSPACKLERLAIVPHSLCF